MAIVAVRCPSCNGDVELDQDREFGFCVYCGTKIFIPNAIQRVKGTVSIDNSAAIQSLMVLAKRSRHINNYSEAIRHYDAILALSPQNNEAILYKGLCAIATDDPSCIAYLQAYGVNALSDLLKGDDSARVLADTLFFLSLAAVTILVAAREVDSSKGVLNRAPGYSPYTAKRTVYNKTMQLAKTWEAFDRCIDESYFNGSLEFLDGYCSSCAELRQILDWNKIKEKARRQLVPSIEHHMTSMAAYRNVAEKRRVRQYWEQHREERTALKTRLDALKMEAQESPGFFRKQVIDREVKAIRKHINKPC